MLCKFEKLAFLREFKTRLWIIKTTKNDILRQRNIREVKKAYRRYKSIRDTK